MIDRKTPVLVQGLTGRTGRMHGTMMRAYGTNIVAGVSPRPEAVDGVPVFRTCADAVAATGATATVAFVGADALLGAIREAVEAGINLIVTPTEGMPVHDALAALALVRAAGVRWIGASTPGMAVPGEAKLGFLPEVSLAPGPIGVMSKSGTLSYEVGYRLVGRGLGQSVWIGVGGDPVKGTRYADLVPFFAADARTKAVVVIGEIGGSEEEELAAALIEHKFQKPVFALVAGRSAREGVTMGHAGAMVHGDAGSWASKQAALERAGARVFGAVADLVDAVTALPAG
ncbi:MAG: succinate--CoA ligase subunit alpha [Alphaproteobacteria bacterium]|nr:succinate--CoA ligase subunit alpha [Alphaproteobacteria bacterium]